MDNHNTISPGSAEQKFLLLVAAMKKDFPCAGIYKRLEWQISKWWKCLFLLNQAQDFDSLTAAKTKRPFPLHKRSSALTYVLNN